MNTLANGLDLAPTVVAYSKHYDQLSQFLAKLPWKSLASWARPAPLTNLDLLSEQFDEVTARALFGLFPETAQHLMRVGEVTGLPSLWFHQDSNTKPRPTWCVDRALGTTYVCPAYTGYAAGPDNKLDCTIELYRIPDYLCGSVISRIILSQAFVHELVHTIAAPTWHLDHGGYIKLGDGRVIGAEECMLEFGQLVQDLGSGPISHYSEGYWRDERKRLVLTAELDDMDAAWQVPIMEELCESVAAHLLGFINHPSGLRIGNPLGDRPQVATWIDSFLAAVPAGD